MEKVRVVLKRGTVSLFFVVYFIILRGIVLYREPGDLFLKILKKLILGNSL